MKVSIRATPSRTFVALSAVLAYIVLVGGTVDGIIVLAPLAISQTLAVGTLLIWGVGLWRRGEGIPRSPIDLGIGLFLLAHVLSTLTSVDPRLSLEATLYVFLFVALYYFFLDRSLRSWSPSLIARALRVVSQVVVILALIELAGWRWIALEDLSWGEFARFMLLLRGRFVMRHANPLGWFLGFMTPFWLEQVLKSPTRRRRAEALLWLALLLFTNLSTGSRAGWLAAAAGTAVWVLLALARRPVLRRRISDVLGTTRGRAAALLLAASAAAVLVLGAWLTLTQIRPGTASFRIKMWSLAAQLVVQDPLTGSGPGTFGLATLSLDLPSPEAGDLATHAHNGYVNLAAETGLLGVTAASVVAFQFGRALWRGIARSGPHEPHATDRSPPAILYRAFPAAMAGLLTANLADTVPHFPYTSLLLVLLGAALLAPQSRLAARPSRTPWRLLPVTASLIVTGSFAWLDAAHLLQSRGVAAAEAGNLASAQAFLDSASRIDPGSRAYRIQAAAVRAERYLENGDETLLREALEAFEEEVRSGRHLNLVQSNLAWLRYRSGDVEGAREAVLQAASRTPLAPWLWMNLGLLSEEAGDLGDAREVYATALALEPDRSRSLYWRTSLLSEEMEALLRQAIELVPHLPGLHPNQVSARQAHLAFRAGDQLLAASLLEESAPTEESSLVAGLLALQADDHAAAEQAADRAIALGTIPTQAYLLRGRSLLERGQTELARRDFRRASRLGDPEGFAWEGESLYRQGAYLEAIQAHEAAPLPPCPVRPLRYDFEAMIYHRPNYMPDLTPDHLRCSPLDELIPLYHHLADAYRRVGRPQDADRLESWLQPVPSTVP